MSLTRKLILFLLVLSPVTIPVSAGADREGKTNPSNVQSTDAGSPVLWRSPSDIATRDLFYGPGGKENQPQGTFTFTKEDLKGTNPKFGVRDSADVKWKVKMGQEARPETAATRLVWAAGYFADDDYFLPSVHVDDMPGHLKRGQKLVHDSSVGNVRLKLDHGKKIGTWAWKDDPFSGTRELNGLRVVMALINNWDLKDENNAIYQDGNGGRIYLVSDLGASFGAARADRPLSKSKGNLESYAHSKFITKVTPEYVQFQDPGRPALIWLFSPADFFRRVHMEWIGRQIPRADARWMGDVLSQLSADQIHDAFRAAGYSPEAGRWLCRQSWERESPR